MSQLPPKSTVPRSTSVREDRHYQTSAAAQFRLDRSRSVYADSSEVGAKGSISALMDRDLRCPIIDEKDPVLPTQIPIPIPIPIPHPHPNMIPQARPASTRRDHQPMWTNIPGLRSFSTRWAEPAPPQAPIQATEATEVTEDGKKVPLWKQLLRKFRREARRRKKSSTTAKNYHKSTTDGSKTSICVPPCSATLVLPSLAERPEDSAETTLSNGEKQQQQQKRPAVYPEPLLVRHTGTSTPSSCSPSPSSSQTTPIWERRSIIQPLPLDLSKLRVTGMGRLPRAKVAH